MFQIALLKYAVLIKRLKVCATKWMQIGKLANWQIDPVVYHNRDFALIKQTTSGSSHKIICLIFSKINILLYYLFMFVQFL